MNELLIQKMTEKGMNVTHLAYVLGVREATVYSWVRPAVEKRRAIKRAYLLALSKVFETEEFLK